MLLMLSAAQVSPARFTYHSQASFEAENELGKSHFSACRCRLLLTCASHTFKASDGFKALDFDVCTGKTGERCGACSPALVSFHLSHLPCCCQSWLQCLEDERADHYRLHVWHCYAANLEQVLYTTKVKAYSTEMHYFAITA